MVAPCSIPIGDQVNLQHGDYQAMMRTVLRCFLAMENGMIRTAIVNELSFVRNHSVSVYVWNLYLITIFDLTFCILVDSSFWFDTIDLGKSIVYI